MLLRSTWVPIIVNDIRLINDERLVAEGERRSMKRH